MNEQLQKFARNTLKTGLAQLPDNWQHKFKLMYARDNGRRSMEDAATLDIEAVIDALPADKLDWAMTQVQNSINKRAMKEQQP